MSQSTRDDAVTSDHSAPYGLMRNTSPGSLPGASTASEKWLSAPSCMPSRAAQRNAAASCLRCSSYIWSLRSGDARRGAGTEVDVATTAFEREEHRRRRG